MKILIVSGSNRASRESHRLTLYIESELKKKDHEVLLFDIKEHDIPILEDIYVNLENPVESLKILKGYLDQVDHIIVVTPEYNGHFSPGVKNTLDHFKKEYNKKVIGVATASAGKMGGIRASIHMQSYVLALGAYPCPKIGLTPFVQDSFDENGGVLDESKAKGIDSFLKEFFWLSEAVSAKKI